MSAINYLTRIEFGEGAAARLPEFVRELGIARPFVVTDKGLMATGLVTRLTSGLANAARCRCRARTRSSSVSSRTITSSQG